MALPSQLVVEDCDTSGESYEKVSDDGVIRNVLLCGNKSKNGYSIPPSAFGDEENTKRLYEGIPVFLGHDTKSRSPAEMAGEVRNVRKVDGRPRGDIYTKNCPYGETLRNFINDGSFKNLGMSHSAYYTFNAEQTSVKSIDRVISVDCVVYPATTKTFSEQTKMTEPTAPNGVESLLREQTQELKTQLEAAKADLAKVQDELAKLKTEHDTMGVEKAGLEKKLQEATDKLELESRKESVHATLKQEGFDLNDELVCSPLWLSTLYSQSDEAVLGQLIKDRKALYEGVGTSGGTKCPERKTESTKEAKGFNPETFFNRQDLYA